MQTTINFPNKQPITAPATNFSLRAAHLEKVQCDLIFVTQILLISTTYV